jgi:hypothetical protein
VAAAGPTTKVTWWGRQWSQLNQLSGGSAPSDFWGFAQYTSNTPPRCGGLFIADTEYFGDGDHDYDDSIHPPAAVPGTMAVIVTDHVQRVGDIVGGVIRKIILVKTDPGYQPDASHAGTGTILGTLCTS